MDTLDVYGTLQLSLRKSLETESFPCGTLSNAFQVKQTVLSNSMARFVYFSFQTYCRMRGSTSYIVREVRSMRERDTERGRERERERETEVTSP